MSRLGDVLIKSAVSKGRLRVPQSRKGRRPMSVTTYLRKEKDGSLYKAAEPGLRKLKDDFENLSGTKLRDVLSRQRLPGALTDKAREGLDDLKELAFKGASTDKIPGGLADDKTTKDFNKAQLQKGKKVESEHTSSPAIATEIAMDHLTEDKDYYEKLEKMEKGSSAQIVAEHHERLAKQAELKEKLGQAGTFENKVPWYTTAAGATLGGMAGKALKKAPRVGTLLGTLAGTAVGLEGGTALGKKLDKTKLANSGGTMQRIPMGGAARGPEQTNELVEPSGKPASAKRRSGDSPSMEGSPSQLPPSVETGVGVRSMDSALKVSSVGNLVSRGNKFPTSEKMLVRDRAEQQSRNHFNDQWMGGVTPVPGYNPNVDDKEVAKLSSAEEPYTLSTEELEKLCAAYRAELDKLDRVKLASADIEEMHKEALLGALRKVIPKSKKIINLGGETIDLRPASKFNYKGIGKKLEETGNMFRAPKGVSPEMARAAGNTRAGSVSGRVFGEGLHSAGHHMGHTGAVGKTMNPLGKPIGGFIEGITAQGGRELQRAGGAVSTGLKGPAKTLGGGVRGSVGRGMEQHAGKVGLGGEILTAAGTASGLGHAVSPAAQGLASLAKATGTYAPLKGALGSLGFNVAKDVAATGAEAGLQHGGRFVAQGVKGLGNTLGRAAPHLLRFGKGVAGATV